MFLLKMKKVEAVKIAVTIKPIVSISFPQSFVGNSAGGEFKQHERQKHYRKNNSDFFPRQTNILVQVNWHINYHPSVKELKQEVEIKILRIVFLLNIVLNVSIKLVFKYGGSVKSLRFNRSIARTHKRKSAATMYIFQ